jgi:predicted MFS family arabinose efflux permease
MLIDYWRFARANPRFIGFGLLLAFLSSAGQTYFIGVLGTGIQAEFGLDAGEWGRIYMIGTLASAFVLNWSGSLIDRYDLRWFTLVVLLGLVVACLVMSWVSLPLMLIGAIFLLRQFGQGLTSHTGATSMARYHDADRGKAIALASIGYSVGEAILPVLGVLVLENLGWRHAFQIMAAVVIVSIPVALWLLKGHGIRHAEHTAALDRRQAEGGAITDYTRMQVLREPRFYLILPALMAPAAIGTAMFFFPAEIVRAKQWSGLWLTGNYWLYSAVTVTVMVSAGGLIDRFSARQVVPYYLLPFVAGLVVLGLWDHVWAVWPYLGLMGFSIGMYFTGFNALWAELYGARHLGAIKSLATSINVFATALGPAFMGTLLSNGVSFATICLIFAGYCLGATLFLVYALRTPSN